MTEQHYAPITPEKLKQVRTSLLRMNLLLFCPMPIGPGNLSLLQEALMATHRGIKVLILAPTVLDSKPETQVVTVDEALQQTGIAKRDYTNGEGVRLVREMLQAGATVVESVAKAVEAIVLLASSNS